MAENKAEVALGTKSRQLLITSEGTENELIMSSNKNTAITRQLEVLKALTSEIEMADGETESQGDKNREKRG